MFKYIRVVLLLQIVSAVIVFLCDFSFMEGIVCRNAARATSVVFGETN